MNGEFRRQRQVFAWIVIALPILLAAAVIVLIISAHWVGVASASAAMINSAWVGKLVLFGQGPGP